ncbi:MAG: M20 family metallopeptidase [Bryobacterales bacterium]|nr:M20 family metallopeptidase [Bryobacterales bacterium]
MKAALREMVECESPSDDPAAIARFVELFAARVSADGLAECRVIAARNGYGQHLQCEFKLPAPKKRTAGQILGLGHSDTVWPMGTLARMPWREADGRLWGPGVLDMKAGLVFFVYAMRALRDLDIPVARKVMLQIVSDEEVGSRTSRALTEREARKSAAVLVLEPGTGLTGKLKTARKGVGGYTVKVAGKASHAGVDFAAGASAIDELACQIEKIRTFTNLDRGITVNTGVISGGTRSNVVAAEAHAVVDIRIPRLRDWPALERKFAALRPRDKRCTLTVTGELNRPPMERTREIAALFRSAQRMAAECGGVKLEESSTGGGSDGNFTAALGIPTLDGLGAVGEGAHAPHESILADRIADRAAVLAGLVASI